MPLSFGEDIDRRVGWPLGKAERLARQGKLPHLILPDGSVRFEWSEIDPLILRVPLESHGCGEGAR